MNQILQKKISNVSCGLDYDNSLAKQSSHIQRRPSIVDLPHFNFSKSETLNSSPQPCGFFSLFSIIFCLHSNHIKATILKNVYDEIGEQRRYKTRLFLSGGFPLPENKVPQNRFMEVRF